MAPLPTYEAPHKQLGRLMVLARRRGLCFESWWEEAVRPGRTMVMVTHARPPSGAVLWPTDRNAREEWRVAIMGSQEGWRRAFERAAPSRAEEAIAFLGDALGLLRASDPELVAGESEHVGRLLAA